MELARLKKRSDFLLLSKNGRRWVTPAFVMQIRPDAHPDENTVRIGFTCSKKLDKRAVVRNRTKRRLRALSDAVLPNYPLGGYDVVFIGRSGAITDSFDKMIKDCHWALKRLNIQRNEPIT